MKQARKQQQQDLGGHCQKFVSRIVRAHSTRLPLLQMPIASPDVCDSAQLDINWRFSQLLFWLNWFPRVTHRTQESSSFTRLVVYLKNHKLSIARWERFIEQGSRKGRGPELPCFLGKPLTQSLCMFTNLFFRTFMEALLCKQFWLNKWSLVINSTSTPTPLSGVQVMEQIESFNNLIMWLIPPATILHPQMLSKSQFININSDVVERSLL